MNTHSTTNTTSATARPRENAPWPLRGYVADGFEPVAREFAAQFRGGQHAGAAFAATIDGKTVVDLWGGDADLEARKPWLEGTSSVVFSVTKGLTAMAMHLLAERGLFDWDARVADFWPDFASAGKSAITIRTLFNHRAGLAALDTKLAIDDCLRESQRARVRRALEWQAPQWVPGSEQGYHAVTYGMFARELIERIARESAGTLLKRELFDPLGAEVWLGTPAFEEHRVARLVPPNSVLRVARMMREAARNEDTNEARMARAILRGDTLATRAFMNPATGLAGVGRYGEPDVFREELLWASATATARGLARAYVPFALGGAVDGRRYFREESVRPLRLRQSFAHRDRVLHKPIGWTQGFLKDEAGLFSPGEAGFGHAGLGGALGWCEPDLGVTVGYVPTLLDWRVRSPRTLALCKTLFACAPLEQRRAERAR